MSELIIGLVLLLVGAFLLPIAKGIVRGWTWLCSLGLEGDLQALRRQCTAEFYGDLERERRDEGYHPAEIGAHVVLNWARGIPSDLVWRWALLWRPLAARLLAGSSSVCCLVAAALFRLAVWVRPAAVRSTVMVAAGLTVMLSIRIDCVRRTIVTSHVSRQSDVAEVNLTSEALRPLVGLAFLGLVMIAVLSGQGTYSRALPAK
ncbi:MAG: hypothetical protein M3Q29_18095 [Chloroflexota bacterium]|nr:hypothetical protein [Chloroflexota bacterium]